MEDYFGFITNNNLTEIHNTTITLTTTTISTITTTTTTKVYETSLVVTIILWLLCCFPIICVCISICCSNNCGTRRTYVESNSCESLYNYLKKICNLGIFFKSKCRCFKNFNKYIINPEELDDECSICLEKFNSIDLEKGNNKIVILKCNHKFHYNCIKNDLIKKCPLCREDIVYKSIHIVN